MIPASPADHVTTYDRSALDEATMVALLAAPTPNESLVEYFGTELHAELVQLARASQGRRPGGRRVYVLPGIMGSQLGFRRDGQKPNDVLWLDPIDIQLGRLVELELDDETQAVALGAMNYTYLKITLSLRVASSREQCFVCAIWPSFSSVVAPISRLGTFTTRKNAASSLGLVSRRR